MFRINTPFLTATPAMFLRNSYKGFLMNALDEVGFSAFHDNLCVVYSNSSGSPVSIGKADLKAYCKAENYEEDDLTLVCVYPMADGHYAAIYCGEDVEYRILGGFEMAQEEFRSRIKEKAFYNDFFKSIVDWLDTSAASNYEVALERVQNTLSFWGIPESAWNTSGGNTWAECFNKHFAKRYYSRKMSRIRARESFGF